MLLQTKDHRVEVFSISPRPKDKSDYWRDAVNVIDWSEKYGYSGVLIFSGHDAPIEPFLVAQTLFARTKCISPLVAVNPLYMHPYTVAKMISSFASLYGRSTYLNMVTGASRRFLESIDGSTSHDARYARLVEFTQIVKSLCRGNGLTSFDGTFYSVSALQLLPKVPLALMPRFLIAGESEAAQAAAEELDAVPLTMLAENIADQKCTGSGVHFGVIARETDEEARSAACELFPDSEFDLDLQTVSMKYTDSVWKHRLSAKSNQMLDTFSSGWLTPFRLGRADCPYIVGSWARVAAVLTQLTQRGAQWLVLDIPANEIDFEHTAHAFEIANTVLTSDLPQ